MRLCCVTSLRAVEAASAAGKATVKPSLAEEPSVTVDAASKKMIIKFATVSSTEPTLAWKFAGKTIAFTGGQYSMSKVVKDGQYFYTFEISEVHTPMTCQFFCIINTNCCL